VLERHHLVVTAVVEEHRRSLYCLLLQGVACGLGSNEGQHALTRIGCETMRAVALTLVILLAVLLGSRRSYP
jgi:hypothetical protein